MPTGNLYLLTTICQFSGQDMLNMFHYLQVSGSGDAGDLIEAFEGDVVPAIRNLMATQAYFYAVKAEDKADPTDFDFDLVGAAGLRSGEVMPPHDAVSFTYLANRNDCRGGGKRIGGYPEVFNSSGYLAPFGNPYVAAAEVAFESNISNVNGVWRPVIYGKRYGTPGYFSNPLSGVSFFNLTTQNGRNIYTSPGL